MTKKEIASYIDHTALSAECGVKQIGILCSEALKYGFASVCVNPVNVAFASSELAGSDVKVCTVIGFPLGAATSAAKSFETEDAIFNGADEIDMVINIGAARDGRYSIVSSDIATVVETARIAGEKVNKKIIVKVILETCLLDELTIENCCLCAKKAGADFVKTSTGFSSGGATVEDIKLFAENIKGETKIKAAGGIASFGDAEDFIKLGASRLGTSRLVKILKNESVTKGY